MARQKIDTPLEHLSPQARAAREQRVEQLRILVLAGLYRVDTDSLVRAMLRKPDELSSDLPDGRSLDRPFTGRHAS
jgi:anti-sigma28 factor (negative regulator of flagellin synthesis)